MTGYKKRHFADDIDQRGNIDSNDTGSDLNQYNELEDKWNAIQEEYLEAYPDVEVEDLYFESGGFEGVLEKIAKIRNTTVEKVRNEIQKW